MGRVFISYRRADTEADAGRLYSDLAVEFGEDRLFKDVDNVPLGADVEEHIQAAISDSDLVIVVVGPNWDPLRLHAELDWVRVEIEAAFSKQVPILPIRVRRAELPAPSEVPVSVQKFCRLNAAELEHHSWHRDLAPVLKVIHGVLRPGIDASARVQEAELFAARESTSAESELRAPSAERRHDVGSLTPTDRNHRAWIVSCRDKLKTREARSLPTSEIAKVLNVSASTVRRRLAQADPEIQRLANSLAVDLSDREAIVGWLVISGAVTIALYQQAVETEHSERPRANTSDARVKRSTARKTEQPKTNTSDAETPDLSFDERIASARQAVLDAGKAQPHSGAKQRPVESTTTAGSQSFEERIARARQAVRDARKTATS